MGRNELTNLLTKPCTRGGDDIGFSATGIGDKGFGFQMRQQVAQAVFHLANRHGQQYQVGILQCIRPVVGDDIYHPEFFGIFQRCASASDADDFMGDACGFKRQCKRTADEADAGDDNALELSCH